MTGEPSGMAWSDLLPLCIVLIGVCIVGAAIAFMPIWDDWVQSRRIKRYYKNRQPDRSV